MNTKRARVVLDMAYEFASFARANRRSSKVASDDALREAFQQGEASHLRLALGYRFAARHRHMFDIVDYRIRIIAWVS